jgi:hypothetical protein
VNRDDDGRRIDFHRDGRADDGTEMGRPGGLRSGSVDARVPVVVPSTTTHWLDRLPLVRGGSIDPSSGATAAMRAASDTGTGPAGVSV